MAENPVSDEQPFYTPNLKPAAPTSARVGEPVWRVRVRGRQIDCELRTHGDYGVEVQLYRDLEFYGGRMFPNREAALEWAEMERLAIAADGVQP